MKVRIDRLLVDRKLAASRERAQALILAGRVLVDNVKVEKAGATVAQSAQIRLLGDDLKYVSRGGLKLEKALAHWQIDVTDLICLDVGASTGGFTDCLLQHGAAFVVCFDVGRNQLHERLRGDARVTVMEGVNARHLETEALPYRPELVTADGSFISILLMLLTVL